MHDPSQWWLTCIVLGQRLLQQAVQDGGPAQDEEQVLLAVQELGGRQGHSCGMGCRQVAEEGKACRQRWGMVGG